MDTACTLNGRVDRVDMTRILFFFLRSRKSPKTSNESYQRPKLHQTALRWMYHAVRIALRACPCLYGSCLEWKSQPRRSEMNLVCVSNGADLEKTLIKSIQFRATKLNLDNWNRTTERYKT